jgi:hypothetical protein
LSRVKTIIEEKRKGGVTFKLETLPTLEIEK